MKKMFKVQVEWKGEDERTIVAPSYQEALGEIDDKEHHPDDFMFDDESFHVVSVEEVA